MRLLLCGLLALGLSACGPSETTVTCWSGGVVIYEGTTDPASWWRAYTTFEDLASGDEIWVNADCIERQKN